MNKKKRNYTEDEFKEAVKTSTCIRQVLQKLEVSAEGGSYRVFHQALKEWPVDTSHFLGRGWSYQQARPHKRSLEDYLSNTCAIQSAKLKERLFAEGVLKRQCSKCKLIKWNGLPIPLELDHINGDHSDNSIENLRVICPNCHAQTPTYRGKNVGLRHGIRTRTECGLSTLPLPVGLREDSSSPRSSPNNELTKS